MTSWEIKSFSSSAMEIQLYWNNSLYVSITDEPDVLEITVKGRSLFKAAASAQTIAPGYQVSGEIP